MSQNIRVNIRGIQKLLSLTWIKNTDYQYVSSSNRFCEFLGCKAEKNFYGHDDFSQPWAEYAEAYREEDKQVLAGETLTFLHPCKLYSGEEVLILTHKTPFYDKENTIRGIKGTVTFPVFPQKMKTFNNLKKCDFELMGLDDFEPVRYQINNIVPQRKLSSRERDCLFYLIRGKTAKEIANILSISSRTVENHLISIKDKFGCTKKSEVIEKAIELGYIDLISGPNRF